MSGQFDPSAKSDGVQSVRFGPLTGFSAERAFHQGDDDEYADERERGD
jgi:hypothetical protein